MAFRTKFDLPFTKISWYPGHMQKGMRQMQNKLKNVDCIIEVHDARIPFSGRNHYFRSLTSIKPHILCLNKADLTDLTYKMSVLRKIRNEQNIDRVLFMSSEDKSLSYSQILPTVISLIQNSDRFNRSDVSDFHLMVVGIPNVGKSTVINQLRHSHLRESSAAQVGKLAGVTRSVMERIKISMNPPIYLFDTPGILEPRLENVDTAMRVAICGNISENVVNLEHAADYLLYWLNKHENFNYVQFFGLDKPSDNIMEVLVKGALYLNNYRSGKKLSGIGFGKYPDIEVTAYQFLRAFREGKMGRFMLDDDLLN